MEPQPAYTDGHAKQGDESAGAGRGIQVGSALFLIAGLCGLGYKLGKGSWPAFLGQELSAAASVILVATLIAYGLFALATGTYIRRGHRRLAAPFTVITGLGCLLAGGHILLRGRGWYELGILTILLIDGIYTLSLPRQVNRSHS